MEAASPRALAVRNVAHAALCGAVYGAKIRGPHALVMALLFGRSPLPQLARGVVNATVTHSRQLASFAAFYTLVRAALLKALGEGNERLCALLAGVGGGALMWGDDSPINTQLNLYLLSRVLVGLVRAGAHRLGVTGGGVASRLWSAAMWGTVMAMYEAESIHPYMQPSLLGSMRFIYSPLREGAGTVRAERRDLLGTAAVWLAYGVIAASASRGKLDVRQRRP